MYSFSGIDLKESFLEWGHFTSKSYSLELGRKCSFAGPVLWAKWSLLRYVSRMVSFAYSIQEIIKRQCEKKQPVPCRLLKGWQDISEKRHCGINTCRVYRTLQGSESMWGQRWLLYGDRSTRWKMEEVLSHYVAPRIRKNWKFELVLAKSKKECKWIRISSYFQNLVNKSTSIVRNTEYQRDSSLVVFSYKFDFDDIVSGKNRR